MDVTPESPNLQDNVEECEMKGAKENVSCTCAAFARVMRHTEKMGRIVEGGFFCNREGKRHEKFISNPNRKRDDKVLTRTGCEAMLSVYFDTKSSIWRVRN
ncbi:hypothetical protein PIB30_041357 [Stylosanthes scabra]|uniref:FAR1 domain-containing protein n=1 Tax=Stylosanthes scabra TaxID=79078 RepID=A0ABU6YF67_9FABA|nr:hypothetical protein [Stylosanthes scabra]